MTLDVEFAETNTMMNTSFGETYNTGEGGTGQDGFSPIATVTQTNDGAVISITDLNGTTEAVVKNGADGRNGRDGKDGYTPQKGIDYFTNEDIVSLGIDKKADQTEVDGVNIKIGDIETLNTPTAKILVDAINSLQDQIVIQQGFTTQVGAECHTILGDLKNLQTTDKSNAVAAINELVGNMGDIETALDNIEAIQNSYIGGGSV